MTAQSYPARPDRLRLFVWFAAALVLAHVVNVAAIAVAETRRAREWSCFIDESNERTYKLLAVVRARRASGAVPAADAAPEPSPPPPPPPPALRL